MREEMKNLYLKFDTELFDSLKTPSFKHYFEKLIEVNKVMNLTNITEENEVYLKHFYDSVILTKIISLDNHSILDIGAGAGFPSIPIKLLNNQLKITIVDGLNKRINFLKQLTEELNLSNINLIHGRAEELDQREGFDLVSARAVAKLNILLELAIPSVKINGYFIAYKSINYKEELNSSQNAISTLGCSLEQIVAYEIDQDLTHVLLIFKKTKKTPKQYPRSFAKIKKAPL